MHKIKIVIFLDLLLHKLEKLIKIKRFTNKELPRKYIREIENLIMSV